MYELSRVRLFSVGPPGARYQDVCLDLRGVGSPVELAPQPDLFAPDDLDRVPRRPSPASVLFLENGGGKSVLLKLVFSVLLPGRRQVVGTTNTRVLEKFVLGEDVAHVALEWMHTVTGERVVTGKVSEWRGHVVSSDPAKLIDAWYSFRPADGFGLDELPFTHERRRVTLTGFRERLDTAAQQRPSLRLVWASVHREWSSHLVELGLDPELFRYQRAMNAGEGEAAEAFSFPSDEAFVDFLLRAVVDQEEPRGLAEVVAGYAAKITQRAELELEREFVEGTIERLGPLADAQQVATVARAAEDSATERAHQFAASIAARHRLELRRIELAVDTVELAEQTEREAGSAERRLYETAVELRRRVAVLHRDAAEATHAELVERKSAAAELVAGWHAVDPVLRDQLATAEAVRLRRVVAAEQDRADPVLRARQEAASALASALASAIGQAQQAADTAGQLANEASGRADQARTEELRWAGRSAEHRAGVDQASSALARIRDQLADATRAGLLTSVDEDPSAAAEAAEAAELSSAEAVERCITEHAALRGTRRAADVRLTSGRAEQARAEAEAAAETTSLRLVREQLAELAGVPRLGELLGTQTVELEQDQPALLRQLAAAVEAAEEERAELRAQQQRDSRAVRALGEGGLLPVPDEVEQALAVLETAGIVAHAGWRYLARLPQDRRAATIERVPHLVSGVLLDDPADASRASEQLNAAQLLPCAVVAIGAAEAMHLDGPALDFVIPPNPAMFDERTADQVRGELTKVIEGRRRRTAALESQLDTDRVLIERLRRWRAANPPGRVEQLADAVDRAERALSDLSAERERAEAEVEQLDARSEALDVELPTLRVAEQRARDTAGRLAALRDEAQRSGELTELIRQESAAGEAADTNAARARQVGTEARQQEQEQLRAQDRSAATVANARSELAELPTDTEASAGIEQPASLSVLRAQFRQAESAYATTEVDSDLRAALGAAERSAESARAAVTALPDYVRARATDLLHGTDGGDPAARRAATEQAERALGGLERQVQDAHTELALARRTLEESRSGVRSLAPYGPPTDVEHGAALLEQVQRDHAGAEAAVRAAVQRREAAHTARSLAERSADSFATLVRGLDDLASDTEDVPPIEGDSESAAARWTALRQSLRSGSHAVREAEAQVRKAADDVALLAQEARFSPVTSPVRRHILGVSRADMPAMAGDWLRALRPRLRSLDDDLANIGRHRSGIVTRLGGMVGDALRTLRLAQRLSQLPDGLSDWSGQQFLRIRFDEFADPDELLDCLGEVVDRTAEGYRSGGKEQRDGMSLLLRGVRAAMPKGVRVEMLKPDAVLRAERLRVSEIRDVFSGGQQLTAAIVLYCTMAALRANQRGEGRRSHAGVLFLDNPIGRASAGYLLELQFGVAEALGVQLVYTTGLFDAGALSAFPLIIRLRNDADLRAGRKYLTVDDQVARQLDQLSPEDGTGQLSASRIFRRPGPVPRISTGSGASR